MCLTKLCCFLQEARQWPLTSGTAHLLFFFFFLNAVWWIVMLSVLGDPGSGAGGPAQHAVSGTGRQQLPLLQPLRHLPALLFISHGGAGWAPGQHAEETTVSHLPPALSACWFFFVCFNSTHLNPCCPLQQHPAGAGRDGEGICARPRPSGGGESSFSYTLLPLLA